MITTLQAHHQYLLGDIRVLAMPLDDGWWQLTDVAWREKDQGEPWIWALSPEGTIYEGMVVSGRTPPYRTTGGDTGMTLSELRPA